MYELKKKLALLFALLLLPIICFIATVSAQETINDLIAFSPNKLNFYCKEGESYLTQKITLVGISNENVFVKLIPTDLYDNASKNFIQFLPIATVSNFTKDSDPRRITLTLNVTDAKAGTYSGSIIVFASAPSKFNTTNIEVTAQIKADKPLLSIPQVSTILLLLIPMGLALAWDDKWDDKLKFKARCFLIALSIVVIIILLYMGYVEATFATTYLFSFFSPWDLISVPLGLSLILLIYISYKKNVLDRELTLRKIYAVVFLGLFVAAVSIFAIMNSVFGDLSILSTILLTPFFAHVIGYAKDKRDSNKESKKSATKLYNGGIETALNFLTNILGETGNHYASLTSKNYLPNGTLKRKKWDESSTKGLLPEVPIGYLAKYYRFVDIYNTYYSVGLKIEKAKKEPKGKDNIYYKIPQLCDNLLEAFEHFREKYSELEKTIFAYLTYTKWLLCEEYLKPLDIDLQIPSRGLLLHLVDRGVLKPENFNKITSKPENKEVESYKDKTELTADISALNDNLMEQIKDEIYNPRNRSTIKKELTFYFDKIYADLDALGASLPYIPGDLRDKPAKTPPLKIDGKLKIN